MTFGFNNAGKHDFISDALTFYISLVYLEDKKQNIKYDQIHMNKN